MCEATALRSTTLLGILVYNITRDVSSVYFTLTDTEVLAANLSIITVFCWFVFFFGGTVGTEISKNIEQGTIKFL